jgi:hypothetical protein
MAAITAALISGGLGLTEGLLSDSEAVSRGTTRRRGFQGLAGQEAARERFGGLQENQLVEALLAIKGGFGEAKSELGRVGRGSRQSILDRETALGGNLRQQFVDSGFADPGNTQNINLQRGLAADTNRRLTELDSSLAGLFSDLATRRAGAEAGARGNLASFFGQQGQIQQGIERQRTDFLTGNFGGGQGGASGPSDFSGLGQGLGGLFGSLFGDQQGNLFSSQSNRGGATGFQNPDLLNQPLTSFGTFT